MGTFRRPPLLELGRTLSEVIIALSLTAVMGLGIFGALKGGLSAWMNTQQFAGEHQNARILLDRVGRQIRMIGYGYEGHDPAIIIGNRNEIAFYADFDVDGTPECRRFYLENGIVYQAVDASSTCAATIGSTPGQPMTARHEARDLTFTELIFDYYNAATDGGKELVAPLDRKSRFEVRRVNITARVRGLSLTDQPFELHTQAVVRTGR